MIIEHCTEILRQIEDGKATNWPKLQEAGRDPVVELTYALLHGKADIRNMKRVALDSCTVRRVGERLELIPADDDLDGVLVDISEMESRQAAMNQAIIEMEQIFADLNIKEPLFKSLEQRERSILNAIEKAKSEISLAARRVMHTNRDPMSPEQVLSDPRYCEVRAKQTLCIEAREQELEPIKAAREQAEAILERFDLQEIDITGAHYLLPQEA